MIYPASFAFASLPKGKRNHHCQQGADVVAIAPAAVDTFTLNDTVNDDIMRNVDVQKLAKQHKANAQAGPGKIVLRRLVPLDGARKNKIHYENSHELNKSKQQVADTPVKIMTAKGTAKQIPAAEDQHSGQELPFAA